MRAVFLDRDGVLNKERKDHVKSVRELEIIPGVPEAIAKLSPLDLKIITITNQSVINRGLTTREEVEKIHKKMSQSISAKGGRIDAVYYCPHRPDEDCDCRKPKTGLFRTAALDFDLDLGQSWFVGDKETDAEAANKLGCHFIRVQTNEPGQLASAVSKILNFESSKNSSE
ncbi:MAG: HAD family hydrolase [Thaumarchaeota archaeon]|nr:HAD family hydrolase [Nitrososphaerota archaeon]